MAEAAGESELLIGCGASRTKYLCARGREEWRGLVTLDLEARHKPDHVWDLNDIPLPFGDDSFDEIHAYHVLEHVGRQGDWRFFFAQWSDFWRILKPGAVFFGIVPLWNSPWAFGDPSHTRILPAECLTFLDQPEYDRQVGRTAMADFRSVYKADFALIHRETDEHSLQFALRAVKPSRCTV